MNLRGVVITGYILAVLIFYPCASQAWWATEQIVEELPDATMVPKEIQADFTGRLYDPKGVDNAFKYHGVDGWLTYNAVSNNKRAIFLMYYIFSNSYPRTDAWQPSVLVEPTTYDPNADYWGQSIVGYYEPRLNSRGQPAAYISFLSKTNNTRKVYLCKVVTIPEDPIDFAITEIDSWEIDSDLDSSCHTRIVKYGNNIAVMWDEVDLSDGLRDIKIAPFQTIEEADEGEIIVSYSRGSIVSVEENIDTLSILCFETVVQPTEVKDQYRGVVCWQRVFFSNESRICAKGFQISHPQGSDVIEIGSETIVLAGDSNMVQIYPDIMCRRDKFSTTNENDNVFVVSWRSNNPGDIPEISLKQIHYDSNQSSLLFQDNFLSSSFTGNAVGDYGIAADRGLLRPQCLSFDPETKRLIFTNRANNRVGWIVEPAPLSTPIPYGAWIAELIDEDSTENGRISRFCESGPNFEIDQLIWVAQAFYSGSIVTTEYGCRRFPINHGENMYLLRTDPATQYISNHSVHEIEMVSDDYSSLYCFYLTQDTTTGCWRIRWNSDGLLLTPNEDRDRFLNPYDVDVIPPVWTPTETPTPPAGTTFTPAPTSTPRPDGFWVADMTGPHRKNGLSRDDPGSDGCFHARVGTDMVGIGIV